MGSGAPSGASMPSGSPPLHLGGSLAPLSFPPYDYRLVMSPVPPGRQDIQVHDVLHLLSRTTHHLSRDPADLSIGG